MKIGTKEVVDDNHEEEYSVNHLYQLGENLIEVSRISYSYYRHYPSIIFCYEDISATS